MKICGFEIGELAGFFQFPNGSGLRSNAGTIEARTAGNTGLAPIAGSALSISNTLLIGTTSTFTGAATFLGSLSSPGMILNTNGALQTTGVGGSSVAGNARGTGAVDLQVARTAATQVASGNYSFVAGFENIASGTGSIALGGGCIASGNNSAAIGYQTQATNTAAVALGYTTQATGTYAFASGLATTASGFGSTAFGNNSLAAQNYSAVFGVSGKSKRYGELVLDSLGTPTNPGDSQASNLVAWVATTNATPTVLNRTNCIYTLDNDSSLYFEIRVVARRTDADNESAAFKLEGCIDRNTTAASTALVGSVAKTVIARDSAAWDVAIDADTTNGALRITVTGEAGKSIRWTAHTKLVEIVG